MHVDLLVQLWVSGIFSRIRQLTSLQNTCYVTPNFAPLQVLLFVTLS